MRFILSFLLFVHCFQGVAGAASAELGLCDKWVKASPPVKGVMVVAHGLNLRPAKMGEMGKRFAEAGYEVLQGGFTGHCGVVGELGKVQALQWEADARRLHSLGSSRARELGVRLYLTAYSFSGLIFQVLSRDLPFHKQILFAPAIETHFWYPIVVSLAGIIPDFSFPSMVPSDYRANEEGNLRSILALEAYLKRWREGEGRGDSSPTLIWIDPEDELVNAKWLQKFARQRPTWTFNELSVKGSSLKRAYHHLIIDSSSMGTDEWKRVMDTSVRFLDENPVSHSSSL